MSLLAGVLSLVNRPECKYWRLAASVVIVFGALETFFLTWTFRQLEQGALLAGSSTNHPTAHHQLSEGRNVLLTALATTLTISTRLRSAKHGQFLDYFRTFIIFVLGIAILPTIIYSIPYYVPALANAITHILG